MKITIANNIYNLWRARSLAQFPWSFFSSGPGRETIGYPNRHKSYTQRYKPYLEKKQAMD